MTDKKTLSSGFLLGGGHSPKRLLPSPKTFCPHKIKKQTIEAIADCLKTMPIVSPKIFFWQKARLLDIIFK